MEMPCGLSQRQSGPAWGLILASINDSAESQASTIRWLGPTDRTQESEPPNGLELSCPAEAGNPRWILAHNGGPGAPPYAPARRVSFSELLARSLMTTKSLGPFE